MEQDRAVAERAVTLFRMSDQVVCSQCGARSPAEADWCGQCFASLGEHTEEGHGPSTAGDLIEIPAAAPTQIAEPASQSPLDEGDDLNPDPGPQVGTWVCTVCGISNPLELELCSACGTSVFTSFGAAVEEPVKVDPQHALLRSLVFPGLGHAYAKQGLLGLAIGGLALMSLGFGIGLVVTGVGSFGWPLILQTAGVWVAAAFDAYRIAGGQGPETLLLRPRVVTALVGTVMVVVMMAAFLRGSA